MKLNEFLSQHPVFTLEELDHFLAEKGSTNRMTRNSLLSYYRSQGRIITVRRGLYIVTPFGVSPETNPIDPYLLTAKMTKDAVLAYHTALEFYGKAYSVFDRFYYVSERKSLPLRFRSYEFLCVLMPQALRVKGGEDFGVNQTERSGVDLRVTSLERTLVDVLDRPDLSGSWEEIWRSLESVEFFDLDKMIDYALFLGNATTMAKVGFFLEQHREALMVDDAYLNRLRNLRPRQPHYMERSHRRNGLLIPGWNLVVPKDVVERSWAEVL